MSGIDNFVNGYCDEACELMPECLVCGQRKRPRGRSVGLEAENGYCGWDCSGYGQAPHPGHLWPGELAQERAALPEKESQ